MNDRSHQNLFAMSVSLCVCGSLIHLVQLLLEYEIR